MTNRTARLLLAVMMLATSLGLGLAATPANAWFQATPEATSQESATPEAAATFTIEGHVVNPGEWTVADLQQFPVQTVESTYISGGESEDHTFTGVLLSDVLAAVELQVADDAEKNASLRSYLVFTASDGYQIIISGGEVDPGFGNRPYLLAWEQDGEPLSVEDGPVRLVLPGDVRGGRHISGIVSIVVESLDAE